MYHANADLRSRASLEQILNPAATTLAIVLRIYSTGALRPCNQCFQILSKLAGPLEAPLATVNS